MEAVVEFQAFCDNNNRFVLKELAIVSDAYRTQIVFAPPYDRSRLNGKAQRTARWLTRNYHKIKWDEGRVPYSDHLMRSLLKPFTTVRTKGLEKVRFLQKFHFHVCDVTDTLDYNNINNDDDDSCGSTCLLDIHKKDRDCACALRSALFLYKYSCAR